MKHLDPGKLRSTTDIPLIDSHIHLDSKAYAQDWQEVARQAGEVGIGSMIVPATSLDSSDRIASLAKEARDWARADNQVFASRPRPEGPPLRGAAGGVHEAPRIYPTAGIHPHDAASFEPEVSVARLRTLLQAKSSPEGSPAIPCVAIGETGLEKHYDFCSMEQQTQSLRAHLDLARELRLPLILHCRMAEADLYDELVRAGPFETGGVVHCFTGSWEWGERFLELGFHLGVGGLVTLANAAEVHQAARRCPLDRILLETDGPYLTPRPFRGQRNESAMIPLIAEEIARLREISVDEVARATTQNCIRLFGLPPTDKS